MAETALDQLALDRIIWVPTYHPAYKPAANLLNFQHRVEMVRRAIDAHPQFSLSTLEQDQPSPSHAVNTLINLQSTYPDNQWYWIIGLDAFQTLPHWYRYSVLVAQCRWGVIPRRGSQRSAASSLENCSLQHHPLHRTPSPPEPLREPASLLICRQIAEKLAAESLELKWQLLEMPLIEISSSLVRQRCGDRHSIRYLVPESVRTYIEQQGLYREIATGDQKANS